jgi:hypothetical protein
MDGGETKPLFHQPVGQYLRQIEAFVVPYIPGRNVKRETFGVIEVEITLTLVEPRRKVMVIHSVMVNGQEYVGIHSVGAIGAFVQSGGRVLVRHEDVGGTEPGEHQLLPDALR